MDVAFDILLDAVVDTLKLVPFLFVTYWAMEALERHAGGRAEAAVRRAGAWAPAAGALVGAVPQCGFSAAAATLFAGRVITPGTLLAVFLSTSDEMLPIFLAEAVDPALIARMLGLKVAIGLVMGFAVDAALRLAKRPAGVDPHIHDLCEQDDCGCEEEGSAFRSAVHHTLQVTLFIFLVTLALGAAISLVGEGTLAAFMAGNPVLSVFACALVGLVPNCAASVVVTELFLAGTIGFGACMAGLLVGAGVGLLVLCRTNRHPRQNAAIVAVLYAIGVVWGLLLSL